MAYLIISLAILLLGVFLIKRERNSFLNGIIFSLGFLSTVMISIIQVLSYIGTKNTTISNFMNIVIYIAILFVLLAVIFSLLASTFLTFKREGRSPTVFMGFCLLVNFLFILAYPLLLNQLYVYKVPNMIIVTYIIVWFLDLILTFLFVLYLLYSILHQIKKEQGHIDYIVTLGSGITSEKVTPLLKSRLDKGIEYFIKNPHAVFIVSGGQGPDEPVSEAYAMSLYLYSRGIPKEQVILEDLSTTTYENMAFSKNKIIEHAKNNQISKDINTIFTTNNYHVFRASLYANKVNFKAKGIGAPTAHYFLPNALIREFFALLMMHRYQIAILLILGISFVLLTQSGIF